MVCLQTNQVQKRVAYEFRHLVVSAAFESVDDDLRRQLGPEVRVVHRNVPIAIRDQNQIAAILSGHHQEFRIHRVRRLRRFHEWRIIGPGYREASHHVCNIVVDVSLLEKKKNNKNKNPIGESYVMFIECDIRIIYALHVSSVVRTR